MASINAYQPNNRQEDALVGGFTVVRDKLRYKKPQVKEVLPHWITSGVSCSSDLSETIRIKKFKRVNDVFISNLKTIGIKRFFPVQSAVIPYMLDIYEGKCIFAYGQPRDICISAPTGSGKTLAYVLPIIQLLNDCRSKVIRAVIVLPVRDLAKQVAETIKELIVNTSLRVVLLTGETSFTTEHEQLFLKTDCTVTLPDIVVCTPGRLVDHIYNTPNFCLEHVRFLVIDEADRVIVEEKQDWYNVFEGAVYGVMGSDIQARNKQNLPKRFFPMPTIESQSTMTDCTLQKILLSATLTHDPEPLKRFRLNFPRLFISTTEPLKKVNVATEDKLLVSDEKDTDATTVDEIKTDSQLGDSGVGVFSTPSGLKEFFVELKENQKPMFLAYLVKKLGHTKILCFANSRETTKRLAFLMTRFDGQHKVAALNAGIPLAKRTRILKGFASGEIQMVICTDAVARGIDIEAVSCVVSYEAPSSTKTYVHRIGRTARAGRTGIAYTLLLHNQIRFFKASLKSVGKQAKNFSLHSSQLRVYQKDYQKALDELQTAFQTKQKDAFGMLKTSSKPEKASINIDEEIGEESVQTIVEETNLANESVAVKNKKKRRKVMDSTAM